MKIFKKVKTIQTATKILVSLQKLYVEAQTTALSASLASPYHPPPTAHQPDSR
uniref:Uncharacterized protein n=1 Tax=Anguilla anguilla TaxID=7936 RepID=A0A0E9R0B5_ANGAN